MKIESLTDLEKLSEKSIRYLINLNIAYGR